MTHILATSKATEALPEPQGLGGSLQQRGRSGATGGRGGAWLGESPAPGICKVFSLWEEAGLGESLVKGKQGSLGPSFLRVF